uniref:Uncharacterized protein n=1 Tax=Anguilla anguilla TaxID=7936 RepID=A0A0E9V702_ANGAN
MFLLLNSFGLSFFTTVCSDTLSLIVLSVFSVLRTLQYS